MRAVRYLAPARLELVEAIQFYDRRSRRVARSFLAEVRGALDSLCELPEAAPVLCGEVRRKALRKFPYSILFVVETDVLLVVAVMHGKRRPEYWIPRLG